MGYPDVAGNELGEEGVAAVREGYGLFRIHDEPIMRRATETFVHVQDFLRRYEYRNRTEIFLADFGKRGAACDVPEIIEVLGTPVKYVKV